MRAWVWGPARHFPQVSGRSCVIASPELFRDCELNNESQPEGPGERLLGGWQEQGKISFPGRAGIPQGKLGGRVISGLLHSGWKEILPVTASTWGALGQMDWVSPQA